MRNYWFLKIVTLVLFLALLPIGFNLAKNKPLWNDEVYSQDGSIEKFSYGHLIIHGPARGESNASPLFYILQKMITDSAGYKLPVEKIKDRWHFRDPQSQIILRIQPVIFMSLAIALIFYFFSRNYSIWAGIFSLMVSLSAHMVWLYWAEARHYALWVLLTVMQCILYLLIIKENKINARTWRGLITVHILLSLTAVVSMGQIIIVSGLLFVFCNRKWKQYIFMTIVPSLFCLYCFFKVAANQFWLGNHVMGYIFPCLPAEQMILFACYGAFLLTRSVKQKKAAREGGPFLLLTALIILAAFAVLAIFKIREVPGGNTISTRYFIFLTPVAIMATTLFGTHIVKAFEKNRWLQINVIIILVGLVVWGFFKNTYWVIGLY